MTACAFVAQLYKETHHLSVGELKTEAQALHKQIVYGVVGT